MPSKFVRAEGKRIIVTNAQRRQIAKMYKSVVEDISQKVKSLEGKDNISSVLRLQYLQELQEQIAKSLEKVDKELYKTIQKNMETVSKSVVKDNQALLKDFGYSDKLSSTAFMHVPEDVINNIMSGELYKGKWSLSKAIWQDNALQNKDLETIVSKGIAGNKSTYEIAKDLEKYVNPSAKKDWEWSKVYPHTRKKIDYNAQRLARTMVSHAYQESFVRTTKNNPFIEAYKWLPSYGDRMCELCRSRGEDNQYGLGAGIFPKDQLPLDHPNGMCTFSTVIKKSNEEIADDLADWVQGKGSAKLNEELNRFANDLGLDVEGNQFNGLQEKYLKPYGFTPDNMPKDFDDWSHKLDFEQGTEILESMGTDWGDPHPYQKLMKYYQENLAQFGSVIQKQQAVLADKVGMILDGNAFANKYGHSKGKTFNYWYTKLDDEAKAIAKQLKESSGLTWQQWYEQNIFDGSSKILANATSGVKHKNFPSNWLERAKGQTEEEMLRLEEKAFTKLTEAEKNGIKEYTGSSYCEMNGYLREIAQGKTHEKAMFNSGLSESKFSYMQDAISGLKKATLEKDMILRRGTDLGDLAGFMPGNFTSNYNEVKNMSLEELKQRFEGTVGVYAGFTSTSSLYNRGFTGDVEIIYNAPKGIQGSSIMRLSKFGTGEGETLLNVNTKVFISKIEQSDGHKGSTIRIFMDILSN